MKIKSFDSFQEKKSEKWIQDAIQKPGALRKEMGKKEGEKISSKEINQELNKLKNKDKDPSKKGVQGLNKPDLKKFRQLNLAKTLKGLKESHDEDTQNYMFFSNLEHICRMVTEISEMPHDQVDAMLTEHDWASDHMSRSFESISHVYNFLMAMMNGEEYEIPASVMEAIEISDKEQDQLNKRNSKILASKVSDLVKLKNGQEFISSVSLNQKEMHGDNNYKFVNLEYKLKDINKNGDSVLSLLLSGNNKDGMRFHIYISRFNYDEVENLEELQNEIIYLFKEAINYIDILSLSHVDKIEKYIRYYFRKKESYVSETIKL